MYFFVKSKIFFYILSKDNHIFSPCPSERLVAAFFDLIFKYFCCAIFFKNFLLFAMASISIFTFFWSVWAIIDGTNTDVQVVSLNFSAFPWMPCFFKRYNGIRHHIPQVFCCCQRQRWHTIWSMVRATVTGFGGNVWCSVIETKDGDLNEKGASWHTRNALIDWFVSFKFDDLLLLLDPSFETKIKIIWMIGHATKRRKWMMSNLLATMMMCHFFATIHFSDSYFRKLIQHNLGIFLRGHWQEDAVYLRTFQYSSLCWGVLHAYVDQKLLKVTKLRVLIDDQNTGSRHCSNKHKCNRITTLAYAIMSIRSPQYNIYSP